MDKYQELRNQKTNGQNYDILTDDIIKKFQEWEKICDFTLSDIEGDRVTIHFQTLPESLDQLVQDIYDLCPDVIDQGAGCMDELVQMAEEVGEEIPEEMQQLIEGINFEDENYGLEILKRSLEKDMKVPLWWD